MRLDDWTTNLGSGESHCMWDLQQHCWACNQRRLFGRRQPCWYLYASKRLLCHPKALYKLRWERFYILTWNYVLVNCWCWNISNRFKWRWMHINYPSRRIQNRRKRSLLSMFQTSWSGTRVENIPTQHNKRLIFDPIFEREDLEHTLIHFSISGASAGFHIRTQTEKDR